MYSSCRFSKDGCYKGTGQSDMIPCCRIGNDLHYQSSENMSGGFESPLSDKSWSKEFDESRRGSRRPSSIKSSHLQHEAEINDSIHQTPVDLNSSKPISGNLANILCIPFCTPHSPLYFLSHVLPHCLPHCILHYPSHYLLHSTIQSTTFAT